THQNYHPRTMQSSNLSKIGQFDTPIHVSHLVPNTSRKLGSHVSDPASPSQISSQCVSTASQTHPGGTLSVPRSRSTVERLKRCKQSICVENRSAFRFAVPKWNDFGTVVKNNYQRAAPSSPDGPSV